MTDGGRGDRYEIGGVTAAIRARREGGYVLATRRGFRLLSPAVAPVMDENVAFGDPAIGMNDGGCDPQGRFYSGSMAYGFTRAPVGCFGWTRTVRSSSAEWRDDFQRHPLAPWRSAGLVRRDYDRPC